MKTKRNRKVQDEWAERFSRDLKALNDRTFPLSCTACGMQFDDPRKFLAMTTAAFDNEGLTETYSGDGHHVLDIGRNCPCGHVLVERFMSRRDDSAEGRMFRDTFSRKMKTMRDHGARRSEARDTLLNLLYDSGKEAVMTLQPQ